MCDLPPRFAFIARMFWQDIRHDLPEMEIISAKETVREKTFD